MKSNKRQKIDRSSTAAYAASQPLFDALRKATDAVAEQAKQLATARDVVQSLHAKLVNVDANRHEAYMSSAIDAWKSATSSFCTVFEQLVTVTAPDPTEGRDAGQRHEGFVAMYETAKRAKATAEQHGIDTESTEDETEHTLHGEEPSTTGDKVRQPSLNRFGKRTALNDEDEKPPQPSPQRWSAMLNPKLRLHETGTKVLWEKGELKVPIESLTPDERKAWMIIAGRVRKKARKQATRATSKIGESGSKVHEFDIKQPETLDERKENTAPQEEPTVEYEDISAEVEARLKMKQEMKAAEKAEKKQKKQKRKRESGDSLTSADAAGEAEVREAMEDMDMTETPHGPAKKKTKKTMDDGVATAAFDEIQAHDLETKRTKKVEKNSSGKRKNGTTVDEDDADDAGAKSKKRKKVKL